MLVIRQVQASDVDDLLMLAKKAGKGMTSLPPSAEAISKKIQLSQESFSRSEASVDDFYFMALEDTAHKRVVGTASVYARTGSRQAFYAYRVMPVTHYSHSLAKQVRSELLHLTNDYTDCSEVGSLFIDPAYRGNGRWLAASRYLLMAQFPERFADYVIAELRGIIDEHGRSPFWEAIGRNFFEMEYEEADTLCGTGSNQFITELMPKHPIYTCLLPDAARQAIGTANSASQRAMEFLQAEGYQYENVIDVFDGGPIMRAQISHIRSVRNSRTGEAKVSPEQPLDKVMLIATTSLKNFRVVASAAANDRSEARINLSQASLDALHAGEGETLRVIEK